MRPRGRSQNGQSKADRTDVRGQGEGRHGRILRDYKSFKSSTGETEGPELKAKVSGAICNYL